ncbi:helix-turn-helix domain-containing protein [Anaerotignum sp.]|nr:helix-turn-helix transcriptional regulator [Anaerotignum sp.]MBQ7757654.1 helix-turn-helix transcriptional regulator [Anaerotignum sp.]
MDVNLKIRQLMDERGWSEYRLAKNCGLPQPTFTSIFRRNSIPSITTLEKICTGFGITLSQFFAECEMTELTPDLQEVFDHWAALTLEQREAILMMMRLLHNKNQK